jgi:hypothetical protein
MKDKENPLSIISPLAACLQRDTYLMWEHLIEKETELIEMGYKELTIGTHNLK